MEPSKKWYTEITTQMDVQTNRARYLSKLLFKIMPFSVILGLIAAIILVRYWGIKELTRMLLQVILTLTLGATIFAGFLSKMDKRFSEEEE